MTTPERRYLRPGRALKLTNGVAMRLGLATTLAVRGRVSGQWRTVPVNVLDHAGARYLVSPRGETEWVRNLRAAGAGELRRRGRTEAFRVAEEIPVEARQPLLDAYRAKWGTQTRQYFNALPDPADHPVFRVETT